MYFAAPFRVSSYLAKQNTLTRRGPKRRVSNGSDTSTCRWRNNPKATSGGVPARWRYRPTPRPAAYTMSSYCLNSTYGKWRREGRPSTRLLAPLETAPFDFAEEALEDDARDVAAYRVVGNALGIAVGIDGVGGCSGHSAVFGCGRRRYCAGSGNCFVNCLPYAPFADTTANFETYSFASQKCQNFSFSKGRANFLSFVFS